MTFLCGDDQAAGVRQHARGTGWPRPWWIRCNGCGVVLRYEEGAWQQTGPDEHECTTCRAPSVSAAERRRLEAQARAAVQPSLF